MVQLEKRVMCIPSQKLIELEESFCVYLLICKKRNMFVVRYKVRYCNKCYHNDQNFLAGSYKQGLVLKQNKRAETPLYAFIITATRLVATEHGKFQIVMILTATVHALKIIQFVNGH